MYFKVSSLVFEFVGVLITAGASAFITTPYGAAVMGAKIGETVSYTAPNDKEIKVEIKDAKPY
jgi:transcription elongation GreA/GreB family factor